MAPWERKKHGWSKKLKLLDLLVKTVSIFFRRKNLAKNKLSRTISISVSLLVLLFQRYFTYPLLHEPSMSPFSMGCRVYVKCIVWALWIIEQRLVAKRVFRHQIWYLRKILIYLQKEVGRNRKEQQKWKSKVKSPPSPHRGW